MDNYGDKQRGTTMATGGPGEDFESFVRRHFHTLEKSLAMITMDAESAADAAQDTFLRLYLRRDEVDKLNDPVAWLYRVGINRCYDYRRRLKRAARLFDRLTVATEADELHEHWAPNIDFISLVKRLPKQQRIAAVLFYQADLSTKEIARVMHISESAVKSHLQRARERLRPLVEED